MPKSMSIRVNSIDAELEFSVTRSTTGRQLFDQVAKTLGIREVWYFGLRMTDSENRHIWLKYTKRVISQINKYQGKSIQQDNQKKPQLMFIVKFYPEDVAKELIQDITLKMFFLQVKESIVDGSLYCDPEVAVLLASYAAQVKYGDYANDKDYNQFMKDECWLPGRVLVENDNISLEQWQEKIMEWYGEHKGMLREDAMMEYLKIAQDLEMYGVNYYAVTTKKKTPVLLGVDALGINVYDKDNKLTPKLGFQWSDVKTLYSHYKTLVIKPVDKKAKNFVFQSPSKRINKQVLLLSAGNHQLHKRRKENESIEVQQMRLTAKVDKEARLEERKALYMERMQRMEAEKNRTELEDKLQRYQSQYHLAIQELEKSKSMMHLNQHHEDDETDHVNKNEMNKQSEMKFIGDVRDETRSLREKIQKMKEEIDERRNILKLIMENDRESFRKGDNIGSLLNVYSSILPTDDEISRRGSETSEYKFLHDKIEALSLELNEVRQKTREVREDLKKVKRQHSAVEILNKHDLLKYFSDNKDERDI